MSFPSASLMDDSPLATEVVVDAAAAAAVPVTGRTTRALRTPSLRFASTPVRRSLRRRTDDVVVVRTRGGWINFAEGRAREGVAFGGGFEDGERRTRRCDRARRPSAASCWATAGSASRVRRRRARVACGAIRVFFSHASFCLVAPRPVADTIRGDLVRLSFDATARHTHAREAPSTPTTDALVSSEIAASVIRA